MDDFYNETNEEKDEYDLALTNYKKDTEYVEFLQQVCFDLAEHCEHNSLPLCEYLSVSNINIFIQSI